MPRMLPIAATLVLLTGANAALAEGDADAGRMLAEKYCVRCHDISKDGAFKTYPPSFASIAAFRDRDQIRSRILFPQLHAPMPQMGYLLDHEGIDDLAAYVISLERKPD